MSKSIPEGVLNVRSASLRFGRCLKDEVENLHEGKMLVSFDITKALTGIAAALFGVIRKSVVPQCCSSSLAPRPKMRTCCFFTGRPSRLIRFSVMRLLWEPESRSARQRVVSLFTKIGIVVSGHPNESGWLVCLLPGSVSKSRSPVDSSGEKIDPPTISASKTFESRYSCVFLVASNVLGWE